MLPTDKKLPLVSCSNTLKSRWCSFLCGQQDCPFFLNSPGIAFHGRKLVIILASILLSQKAEPFCSPIPRQTKWCLTVSTPIPVQNNLWVTRNLHKIFKNHNCKITSLPVHHCVRCRIIPLNWCYQTLVKPEISFLLHRLFCWELPQSILKDSAHHKLSL